MHPGANCLRNSKMALKVLVGQAVLIIDQRNNLHILINNSRPVWPTKILMPFLNVSDNFLQDAYSISLFKTVVIILK